MHTNVHADGRSFWCQTQCWKYTVKYFFFNLCSLFIPEHEKYFIIQHFLIVNYTQIHGNVFEKKIGMMQNLNYITLIQTSSVNSRYGFALKHYLAFVGLLAGLLFVTLRQVKAVYTLPFNKYKIKYKNIMNIVECINK